MQILPCVRDKDYLAQPVPAPEARGARCARNTGRCNRCGAHQPLDLRLHGLLIDRLRGAPRACRRHFRPSVTSAACAPELLQHSSLAPSTRRAGHAEARLHTHTPSRSRQALCLCSPCLVPGTPPPGHYRGFRIGWRNENQPEALAGCAPAAGGRPV